MFEYLKGIVAKIDPAYVVLDVNGIGYKILCPTPYSYQENQPATIIKRFRNWTKIGRSDYGS